jgi:hypothetical protein
MSRAKQSSAIYRPDLGAAVSEFVEGPQLGYIGLEVMPVFRTAQQAATYPVIPKEVLMKIQNTDRAPRAMYNRGDWEYERGTFSTGEQGWEEPLDDVERELFDQEAEGLPMRFLTKPISPRTRLEPNGISTRPPRPIRSAMSKTVLLLLSRNAA